MKITPIQFQSHDTEAARLEKLKRLAQMVAGVAAPVQAQDSGGSVWRTGHGTPPATLGAVGDFYLDVDTGDYYERVS